MKFGWVFKKSVYDENDVSMWTMRHQIEFLGERKKRNAVLIEKATKNWRNEAFRNEMIVTKIALKCMVTSEHALGEERKSI